MLERVLFLDIDGVLYPFKKKAEGGSEQLIQVVSENYMFPQENVSRLNKIVSATDCEIVISSSWRLNHTLILLQEYLEEAGYIGSLLSVTPYRRPWGEVSDREKEISAWLAAHKTKSFAILDDDAKLGSGKLAPFFVQTKSDVGLTDADADKAIRILYGLTTKEQDNENTG